MGFPKKLLSLLVAAVLALGCPALAMDGTLRLPESVKIVEAEAFAGIAADSAVLPDGIKEIRARAFAGSAVEEINLPDSLVLIATDAFEDGCLRLVYVREGTCGWQWAVERGYIVLAAPLSAVLTCDAESVRIGDTVTWTAAGAGGFGGYRYRFELRLDGERILEQPWGADSSFTVEMERQGICRVTAWVSDGDREIRVNSPPLNVDPEQLKLIELDVERSSFYGAETHNWRAAAEGGVPPYRYSFALRQGDDVMERRELADDASYSYTFFKAGDFTLAARVTDAANEAVERELSFSASPEEYSLKAKVRIYIDCDKDGNILRSNGKTGHYELQLGNSAEMAAFNGYLYEDPVFSYGFDKNKNGVVTVFDGETVPRAGCLLYTFELTTKTSKVGSLMHELLQDAWLDTDSGSEHGYGRAYPVETGDFSTYRITTSNCFTAVAAWCQCLGYGKLSAIEESSASYTDYLAWRMFDRYGHAWRFQGQY